MRRILTMLIGFVLILASVPTDVVFGAENEQTEISEDSMQETAGEIDAQDDGKETEKADDINGEVLTEDTKSDRSSEEVMTTKADTENDKTIIPSGSSWQDPEVITVNKPVKGSIQQERQVNIYKFVIDKPGYVDFDFSHGYKDSNTTYWVMSLCASQEVKYLERKYIGNEGPRHDYGTGLAAGTYYIMIEQDFWAYLCTEEYTFTVNYKESALYEKEINDSMDNANVISVNTEYSGNTMQCYPGLGGPSGYDQDWYKFTLTKPGYVSLSFCNDVDLCLTGETLWYVDMYQGKPSDSTKIREFYFLGEKGERDPIFVSGLPEGEYYVHVMPDLGTYHAYGKYSQKTYRINVKFTGADNYETEINDSYTSPNARSLKLNTWYYGNSVSKYDVDYYKFKLDKTGNVRLDFSHGAEINYEVWNVKVYKDSDFSKALIEEGINSPGTTKSKTVSLKSGTYYVKIDNGGDKRDIYHFRIVPVMKVTADKTTISVGETVKLKVTNSQGGDLTFSSDKPEVARVDNSGKVTGRGKGTAKITVTSASTGNSAAVKGTITIKVTGLGATSQVNANNTSKGIKLGWKKVSGAKSYLVYCNNKQIDEVSKTNYTDNRKLKNGKKYTYKIVAKANGKKSKASTSVVIYRLDQGKIKSASGKSKNRVLVKWKKNSKASGYQVQYSTSSKFAQNAKDSGKRSVTGNNSLQLTLEGLSGGNHYVRIRSYIKKGGKTWFSAWSESKKIKVTK